MKTCAFILFVCAGLLLSGGAILGATTTCSLIRVSYYMWTSDLGVELGGLILMIGAAVLCLPTCWLTSLLVYQQPRHLTIHATCMGLAIATMLLLSTGLLSLAGLSRALRDPAAINASMMRALSRTYDTPVATSFTAMQLDLQCCGVQSYRDWYLHRPMLPSSCCGQVPSMKVADQCSIPLYQNGCLKPALLELRHLCNSTSVLGYCLILVLTITLFAIVYVITKSVNVEPSNKNNPPVRLACFTPPNMNYAALTSPVMMQNQLLPPQPPQVSAPTM